MHWSINRRNSLKGTVRTSQTKIVQLKGWLSVACYYTSSHYKWTMISFLKNRRQDKVREIPFNHRSAASLQLSFYVHQTQLYTVTNDKLQIYTFYCVAIECSFLFISYLCCTVYRRNRVNSKCKTHKDKYIYKKSE